MNVLLLLLRMTIVLFTLIAALMMGCNKQSISKAVAVVGTTTIYQTYTTKFQQTPAFVFFVIANAIVGFYNLVVLILRPYFNNWKAFHVAVNLMDLAMFALLATGAAAATSIAELGKDGNLNARWSPICSHFGQFCIHGGLAILSSFIGALLLMILNALSVFTLYSKVSD
ncbi:CASP-like protein 1B1 [Dendrobium catenatum]|uniref:CASP-like protein n=1 Tax=Dendrobium catenatum TaxID=906689 RepID=A0A2I0VE69_9ASPA|nr:CASP-like protein 1B1 [Dendrobium catenatum]PKU61712.1 CASP-like protein [Dendrobium catenatum]